jgi:hypothetical protein
VHEISSREWLTLFKAEWHQGEHVVILGPTGTGKTYFSQPILDIREYVCVLAVKPRDDTLERFRDGWQYGYKQYSVIKKWPPPHGYNRVVYWEKPKGIDKTVEQAQHIHKALDIMYRQGSWTIYFDDAGYIAGTLGLGRALGVLLNQGRSSHLNIVVVVQRPTSVVARVPKEAFSQPRHKLLFKYENRDELKAAATVADMDVYQLQEWMRELQTYPPQGYSDFIYAGKGKTFIVRNEGN